MKIYIAWIFVWIFCAAIIGGFLILRKGTSGVATPFPLGARAAATTSQEAIQPAIPDGYKKYRNEQLGFYYPADIPPREYDDHTPEFTVAFQKEDGEAGFQIYTAPIYGEEVTKERFFRDEPSGARKDSHDTSVDGYRRLPFTVSTRTWARPTRCGSYTTVSCTKCRPTKNWNHGSIKFWALGHFYNQGSSRWAMFNLFI